MFAAFAVRRPLEIVRAIVQGIAIFVRDCGGALVTLAECHRDETVNGVRTISIIFPFLMAQDDLSIGKSKSPIRGYRVGNVFSSYGLPSFISMWFGIIVEK